MNCTVDEFREGKDAINTRFAIRESRRRVGNPQLLANHGARA